MMGSSWGIRVFLQGPRGGIAGFFLLILFLMVPVVVLLPWPPSGRCPELFLYGGLVCGFYLEAERLPALLIDLCSIPFVPRILSTSFSTSEWLPCPAALEGTSLLSGEVCDTPGMFLFCLFWVWVFLFFPPSCCLLLKHTNPLIPP